MRTIRNLKFERVGTCDQVFEGNLRIPGAKPSSTPAVVFRPLPSPYANPGGEAFEYTRGRFAPPLSMRVYRDHSFSGDETNQDYRYGFFLMAVSPQGKALLS